jgi:CheY-like chemotaxis protein
MMPEITGMDLYEAIAQLDATLARRFAFMTGGAFTPRAQRFLSSVSNSHIEKPFKLEDFRAFVRAAADGRQ